MTPEVFDSSHLHHTNNELQVLRKRNTTSAFFKHVVIEYLNEDVRYAAILVRKNV